MFEWPGEDMFQATLPSSVCTACDERLPKREHRIYVRATWRPRSDVLCRACWLAVCEWAKRFALQQRELPL